MFARSCHTTCVYQQKLEEKLIDYSSNPTILNLLTSQRVLLVTLLYSLIQGGETTSKTVKFQAISIRLSA